MNVLSKSEFRSFPLLKKERYNHDVFRYSIGLPHGKTFGLPVASCVVFRAAINGKEVIRPYTPSSHSDLVGKVEFLVKSYEKGNLSKHLSQLDAGDSIEMKGPFPKILYPFKSNVKHLIMLAGGSGITPMIQILYEMELKNDRTKVDLIFANKTEKDIILKEELDRLADKLNFDVHYILSSSESGYKGLKGHIDNAKIEKITKNSPPPFSNNIKILVCGPPRLMKSLSGLKNPDKSQGDLSGLLKEMGYNESNVYKF